MGRGSSRGFSAALGQRGGGVGIEGEGGEGGKAAGGVKGRLGD